MRMSTAAFDEGLALATIAAAADAGVTVFDTARSYGPGPEQLGHNERLLARGIANRGDEATARIITKGGMARTGGGWIPDGRARTILGDCEASLVALGGLPIDLFLLHAPDPRTPWSTSLRALVRAVEEGMARRVGLSNVSRQQLDQALDLAPIAAVQVALSVFDDQALRGGVLERCMEAGVALIAHSPLGGPKRARRVGREPVLAEVAEASGASAPEVALAWLLELSPLVVAIPGATRPATARSSAAAARLVLDQEARARLALRFGAAKRARPALRTPPDGGEVVIIMGIPGAGKSRVAREYVARGYTRLNRDARGGSLRGLADTLRDLVRGGARRLVLDNTYLTRASRNHVVEAASASGLPTTCVWVDTPLAQAQVNLVERLLARFEGLPDPETLKVQGRREPGLLLPASQMRAQRDLEVPSEDEGFVRVERLPFARSLPSGLPTGGVFVAAAVLGKAGWEPAVEAASPTAPHLVFDWRPMGTGGDLEAISARLASVVQGPVVWSICPHGGGPPSCWCRPPLPGLPLAFARANGVDASRSILVGTGVAARTLAAALGARYIEV